MAKAVCGKVVPAYLVTERVEAPRPWANDTVGVVAHVGDCMTVETAEALGLVDAPAPEVRTAKVGAPSATRRRR